MLCRGERGPSAEAASPGDDGVTEEPQRISSPGGSRAERQDGGKRTDGQQLQAEVPPEQTQ